jgi:hypothetical protein
MSDANFVHPMGNDWRLTGAGHDFLNAAVPNTFEAP